MHGLAVRSAGALDVHAPSVDGETAAMFIGRAASI